MRIITIIVTLIMMSVVAFAETPAQYDKRTNFDGYGSAQNRYQNMILLKTHDSILMGGKMGYWNSLDEYYYRKHNMEKRAGPWRGHRWTAR